MREFVLVRHEVWLAEHGRGVDPVAVGLMVLADAEIDWLYVRPDEQGRGVGSALLEHAKQHRPDGLGLWVFASNLAAIAFYEQHGFVPVDATDGDNEEGFPDVRYEYR